MGSSCSLCLPALRRICCSRGRPGQRIAVPPPPSQAWQWQTAPRLGHVTDRGRHGSGSAPISRDSAAGDAVMEEAKEWWLRWRPGALFMRVPSSWESKNEHSSNLKRRSARLTSRQAPLRGSRTVHSCIFRGDRSRGDVVFHRIPVLSPRAELDLGSRNSTAIVACPPPFQRRVYCGRLAAMSASLHPPTRWS